MFDFLENIQAQQDELQMKLATMEVRHSSGDGTVTVVLDGNKQVKDISIDTTLLNPSDSEQLEDLILITMNAAMKEVDVISAQEMQSQLNDMLPGGLDQLFGQ